MPVSKASARAITPAAKGDLAIGSGTNAASVLAVGTNNYVLTADSTQTTGVKWAAASSGALTLVKTGSFTNVASTGTTFNSVFTSSYDFYIIEISAKHVTTSASLYLKVTSGSTLRETNYYGATAYMTPSSGTLTHAGSNGSASWNMIDIGTAAESFLSLQMSYRSGTIPFISGTYMGIQNNRIGFCGTLVDGGSYDGFQVSPGSGNITGIINVYGLAKS